MENNSEKKEDKLQTFKVPKIIKTLSLVYIALTVVYGIISLILDIFSEGRASFSQFQYLITCLDNVIVGFLFWGIGQVFEKFMEKNK